MDETMYRKIRELIRANELMYHIVPLGRGLAGFIYRSRRGRYHIFISNSLSNEAQRRVFLHEAYHAIVDMPNMPFVIGIDMQNERFEIMAEETARMLIKY